MKSIVQIFIVAILQKLPICCMGINYTFFNKNRFFIILNSYRSLTLFNPQYLSLNISTITTKAWMNLRNVRETPMLIFSSNI